MEIVLPTAPRRKPKPIVCHTGASTELYANPRNCRCPKSPKTCYPWSIGDARWGGDENAKLLGFHLTRASLAWLILRAGSL